MSLSIPVDYDSNGPYIPGQQVTLQDKTSGRVWKEWFVGTETNEHWRKVFIDFTVKHVAEIEIRLENRT